MDVIHIQNLQRIYTSNLETMDTFLNLSIRL